jgi:hypothetical protein
VVVVATKRAALTRYPPESSGREILRRGLRPLPLLASMTGYPLLGSSFQVLIDFCGIDVEIHGVGSAGHEVLTYSVEALHHVAQVDT